MMKMITFLVYSLETIDGTKGSIERLTKLDLA